MHDYLCQQCLLVGDSEGGVTVFQLQHMPDPPKPKHQVHTHTCSLYMTHVLLNVFINFT